MDAVAKMIDAKTKDAGFCKIRASMQTEAHVRLVPVLSPCMPRELVIGIDSSTTATRRIAWDRTGAPVAEGRARNPARPATPALFRTGSEDWWR